MEYKSDLLNLLIFYMGVFCRTTVAFKFVNVSIQGLGQCQGAQEYTVGGHVDVFKGIPFAKPPLGSLRFKAPEYISWKGFLNATKFGHRCPQKDSNKIVGNEDCLTLNIYRPSNFTGKLTVMVWIHGGGYLLGGSSYYDGSLLSAMHNVVIITTNYRLGILGFFSMPETNLKGNYGMLDQIAALRWVKKNIASFGGDPDKVTIFGESAGASSVSLLTISPLIFNEGLFHRAISQSGVATCDWAVQPVKDDTKALDFGRSIGCPEKRSISKCLQYKSYQEILRKQASYDGTHLMSPVVDNYFLKNLPSKFLASGGDLQFSAAEVLLGFNHNEGTIFAGDPRKQNKETLEEMVRQTNDLFDHFPDEKQFESIAVFEYTKYLASNSSLQWFESKADYLGDSMFVKDIIQFPDSIARNGKKVYFYEFTYLPQSLRSPFLKVAHTLDNDFVFGTPLSGGFSVMLRNATKLDKTVSRNFMEMWTNFAKHGNPGRHWPVYTLADKKYLDIGVNLSVKNAVKEIYMTRRDAFWNELLPSLAKEYKPKSCKTSGDKIPEITRAAILFSFFIYFYFTMH